MNANSTLFHSHSNHLEATAGEKGFKWRLLLQIAVADMVLWVFPDLVIKSLGTVAWFGTVETGALALPVTLLFILIVMNAMAVLDRVKWLSGGTALITFGAFAVLAWVVQATTVLYVSVGVALALAILLLSASALWFLGTVASMGLGLVMSLVALGLVQESYGEVVFPAVLMILAYPMVSILGVAARKMLKGRSPFMHDRSHLHECMFSAGLNSMVTGGVLLGMSVIFCLVAVAAVMLGMPDTLLYAVVAGLLILFVLW